MRNASEQRADWNRDKAKTSGALAITDLTDFMRATPHFRSRLDCAEDHLVMRSDARQRTACSLFPGLI